MKMTRGKLIGSIAVAATLIATVCIVSNNTSADSFDYAKYTAAKKAEVDKSLKAALGSQQNVGATTNVAPTSPKALPKPNFKIHKVAPQPNGTFQFGFLNQGPTKVQDLWLKDLKPNSDSSLWNEQYVYAGVEKNNDNQGVIGVFVVNTKEWTTFQIPRNVNGSVQIDSINGEIIKYSTPNGSGTLNVVTGAFSN